MRSVFSGVILVILLIAALGLAQARATEQITPSSRHVTVGNGFTYQGSLNESGSPANSLYDFQFILYDALNGGSQVGAIVTKDDVPVANGIFNITLDFGPIFDGTALWLETGVRRGSGVGSYEILTPRQEITATPYALYAINIPSHDHFGDYWSGSSTNGLKIENASNADGAASVNGVSTAASGGKYGVKGVSASTEGIGVAGYSEAVTGWTFGVFGSANSPQGVGGHFANTGGGKALSVAGDVGQTVEADGLVKAAVYAFCGSTPSIDRFFNAVNDQANIKPLMVGGIPRPGCKIDFDFSIDKRFWVAMSVDSIGTVRCQLSGTTTDELTCTIVDVDGVSTSGNIMVLVY